MKEQFQIDQQTSKYAGQQAAALEPGTASFNQSLKLSGPSNQLTLNMQTSDMNDANKGVPGLNTLGNSLIKMIKETTSDSDPKMEREKTEERPRAVSEDQDGLQNATG